MSELTKENVRALGQLCRIELQEEELAELVEDLRRVLDYMEQLQEVDVSDLSPYSHIEGQGLGSLREDAVASSLVQECFLENAPDKIGGLIRVPKIL